MVVYCGLVVELLCSPVGGWFIGVDRLGFVDLCSLVLVVVV